MAPFFSMEEKRERSVSAGFIGKKYISGQSEPINIFSTSYYAPFKLYQIKPVNAKRALYAIEKLATTF